VTTGEVPGRPGSSPPLEAEEQAAEAVTLRGERRCLKPAKRDRDETARAPRSGAHGDAFTRRTARATTAFVTDASPCDR